MVLIVALHTLDVSVDLDHLTSNICWYDAEKIDDIDSISEFLIERIFHDDDLIAETNNDDQRQMHGHFFGFSLIVFCSESTTYWDVKSAIQLATAIRPASRNTQIQFEDHSSPDYNPPDFGQPRA